MTQEDKDLLLKDLCARLPYHPKGHVVNACNGAECDEWLTCTTFTMFTNVTNNCRLYLRLMSSITEEELKELKTLCSIYIPTDSPTIGFEDYGILVFTHHLTNNTYSFKLNIDIIDWLNAHHFDYRMIYDEGKKKYMSMIEKGLAIAVTEENNPYKN